MYIKIREYLEYIPTGHFIWKKHWYQAKPGDYLNSNLTKKGHFQTVLFAKKFLYHRLVWLFHNGWLPNFLDHINRNPSDNRIENLRPATLSQNAFNSCRKNKTGFKGVRFHKHSGLYIARAQRIDLGYFKTPEEAAKAYDTAAQKIAGSYALLNFPDSL